MDPLDVGVAASVVGARIVGTPCIPVTSLCTDTRSAQPGCLFFALVGETTDGHQYCARAAELGASAVVVEREILGLGCPQLVVPDALLALGTVGHWVRGCFDLPVVAVTGSVGKTSTRSMIAALLASRYSVLENERNFNNEIGVPHTLARLVRSHDIAVVELGMRGPGQINYLARMVRPSCGVITNIGLSHLELLGSRAGVCDAKAELLDLVPPTGTAVLPADDPFLPRLRSRCGGQTLLYGTGPAAQYRVSGAEVGEDGMPRFRINGVPFRMMTPGSHHSINAAAACAVAGLNGIDLADCAAVLAEYQPPDMRMRLRQSEHGVTVLDDVYNAAPDSMRAAIETFADTLQGRRGVAVLGEMRELGAATVDAHRSIGLHPGLVQAAVLVTVGDRARVLGETALEVGRVPSVLHADCAEEAAELVAALTGPGDVVLVKGSRAVGLEIVVRRLLGLDD